MKEEWRDIPGFEGYYQVSRETGFNRTGIVGCCKKRKRYKTDYGFKWEYKNN